MHVQALDLARRQQRCLARWQLLALGYNSRGVENLLETGVLERWFDGVYGVAPVLRDDPRARWMAATLTAPETFLAGASAAAAWGFGRDPRAFVVVTRPGNAGPRRNDGVLIRRSATLAGNTTVLHGIPITTPERTLIDLAPFLSRRGLARSLREAIRVRATTPVAVLAALGRHPRARGSRLLREVALRYVGLPIERARSDAEALALVVLREAGRPEPRLNVRVAGEEADLSWADWRLIVELDGPQFHLDAADDLRKQAVWEGAGWTVLRLPTDDLYADPGVLLGLVPATVHESPL